MYRLLLIVLITLTLSCSKEEDTSAVPTWTIQNIVYNSKTVVVGTNDTRWYDVTSPGSASVVNFITIEFSKPLPTVAGTYDIGGTGSDATYIKTINAVVNSTSPNKELYLFDTPSKVGSATLTINNGKRFITFGTITVKRANASGTITSTNATLSCNFLEF